MSSSVYNGVAFFGQGSKFFFSKCFKNYLEIILYGFMVSFFYITFLHLFYSLSSS